MPSTLACYKAVYTGKEICSKFHCHWRKGGIAFVVELTKFSHHHGESSTPEYVSLYAAMIMLILLLVQNLMLEPKAKRPGTLIHFSVDVIQYSAASEHLLLAAGLTGTTQQNGL